MKAPSPAFSFYPKDIFSDAVCAEMSHAQFGMYVRLLCHCWLEGSIPREAIRVQRMLKVSNKTFSAAWPGILRCFKERGDRLVQVRLEIERAKQKSRSKANSNNGRKGGRPLKSTEDETDGFFLDNPQKRLPSPSPSPVRINGTTTAGAVKAVASVEDRTALRMAIEELSTLSGVDFDRVCEGVTSGAARTGKRQCAPCLDLDGISAKQAKRSLLDANSLLAKERAR